MTATQRKYLLIEKGAEALKVIMHYPRNEKARKELASKVAKVHSQIVVEKIKSLSCSVDQKMKLLNTIKKKDTGQ